MYDLKEITYGSAEYEMTLELRNKVMRKPLGLDIYKEDLSCEKNQLIIGAFDGEALRGVSILSNKGGDVFKVEYLCVDTDLQGKGLGAKLIKNLEAIAKQKGGKKATLDARLSAQPFYEKQGYHTVGEKFIMDIAPVGHIVMEKMLTEN